MKKIIRNLKMEKKMMLLPTVVFIFLLALSYGAYDGLSSQRIVIGDMYNNRFKVYQDTTDVIKRVTNIHANIYKVISCAGANYEEAKITVLANEQKSSMEKTIELVQNTLKSSILIP